MTAPWRPRLRDDVAIERTDGRVSLRDAALGHVLPAGRLTQALLPRLDGTQPVAALVGEVAAETGEAPVEVEQALRALLLLHLLEGAGTATVERARAVAAGAPLAPLETLTDARFGCQGSGQCCRVYRPGPLTDVDVAALEAAAPALRAALPELPDEPWIEQRPGDDGQTWRFLRRTAGRCLFLQEDGLCGVHATCGRAAKPEACRLFPFQLVHTLQALRVFDVSECSQFAVARTEGPAHAAFAEEVRFLAPERPRLFHPLTLLDGGTPCDYGPVGALEGRLQEVVRAESDAATRLRRCAGLARAFVDGLRRCPLAAGEPDATVAAALAAEPAPLPSPDAAELALALEACDAALTAALAEGDEPDAPHVEVFLATFGAARSLAADRAGLADGRLPEVLVRARALPLDGDALSALLGASLENRLFGARFLAQGRLRAGVLRVALLHVLTVVGARVNAAVDGAQAVRPADLSAGHWVAALTLSRASVARALAKVEQHAWTVAAGALDGGVSG